MMRTRFPVTRLMAKLLCIFVPVLAIPTGAVWVGTQLGFPAGVLTFVVSTLLFAVALDVTGATL